MFLAFLTSLAGPIKLRIFPIILERMGRFYNLYTKMMVFMNANRICKVNTVFTHGQLLIVRNCDSEYIQNTFIFAFNENIHENKAEYPIQILDYSQVFSYQNRFVK